MFFSACLTSITRQSTKFVINSLPVFDVRLYHMPYLPICGRLDFGLDFSGALVMFFSLEAAAFEVAAKVSGVLAEALQVMLSH